MKRLGLLLLSLALAGCQQQPMDLNSLPPPRESALGETLTLSGTAENWTPAAPAQIRFEQAVVGNVNSDGTFSLSISAKPPYLFPAQSVLLPVISLGGKELDCTVNTIVASSPEAQVYRMDGLTLSPVSATSLAPQLTPAYPHPQLVRTQGETTVSLIYADRDVRISGGKTCTVQDWPWDANAHLSVQTSTINVQLRRGWNTVSLRQQRSQGNRLDLAVEGGEGQTVTPWRYNGVPLAQWQNP